MPTLTPTDRFRKLVDDISGLYLKARSAQVRFAWETGRRIVTEEQNGALRAKYGARLIPELSRALTRRHGAGFSGRNLARMRRFYELNPILPTSAKLDWSYHVELLPVRDGKLRRRLQARALKEGLNSRQLRRMVKEENIKAEREKGTAPLPAHQRWKLGAYAPRGTVPEKIYKGAGPVGALYTYRVIYPTAGTEFKVRPFIDCGFNIWKDAPTRSFNFKQGELVTSSRRSGGFHFAKAGQGVGPKHLYTYKAYLERIVDGDTIWLNIDAGFGIVTRQKVRFNAIDTPEIDTPEGLKARRFVERALMGLDSFIIKTCKSDKYDRYLTDVFYRDKRGGQTPQGSDPGTQGGLAGLTYLNQELLDAGLARRMKE